MSPPDSETRELECPGCGDAFRIRPREGRELPDAVPCPTCGTDIPTERKSRGGFWVSKSRAEIFDRAPTEPPGDGEVEEPVRTPETDRQESLKGDREQPARTFRDVSEVRQGGASVLPDEGSGPASHVEPDPSSSESERDGTGLAEESGPDADDGRPFDEFERQPPKADLAAEESDLRIVEAGEVEDASATPLPQPVSETGTPLPRGDEELEPSAGGSESEAGDESEPEQSVDGRDDHGSGDESSLDVGGATGTVPPPASELATKPFAEWERELTGRISDRSYDVRVHDTVREDLGLRGLVEMFEEGVWTGAVEIREEGDWVPLVEHPMYDELQEYLVGQSRQILLRDQSPEREEGETEPPEETTGEEPAEETDAEPETPEPVESEETATAEPTDDSIDGAEPEGPPEPGEAPADESREAGAVERADRDGTGSGLQRFAAVAAVVLASAAVVLAVLAYLRSGEAAGSAGRAAPESREEPTRTAADASGVSTGAAERADPLRAVRSARRLVREAVAPRTRAGAYLEAGHLQPARRMAIRAMTRHGVDARYRRVFDRSIERDDALHPDPVTIGRGVEVHAIHALGGGWSVSFRMTKNGESAFAFKPSQKHWERGWQAEVAAYHFCEVVACHFDVPRNRPARIRREQFERLYGLIDNEDQRAYRDRFEDLRWVEEEGPDGRVHEYLYGTLKDWVPAFVKWPIEYQTIWQPWLSGDYPADRLEQPIGQALAPLKNRGQYDFFQEIMSERGDATTRTMARGLSCILSFDYLTTNWDRFSTAEKFYGVNNQFADGRFVSLDNGAAFSPHHFETVERRLKPVTRFSASMVASLRALRPEVINPILFPNPTHKERMRLAVFWEQRDRFLDRVNSLIAEHGRDDVLVFR